MQKKLIALAVAGLVSAPVFAQSNVTVYGIADAYLGYGKADDNKFTGVNSGGMSGSRLGFKGSEDLGNGLKAVFTLEYGLNIDQNDGIGTATAGGPRARQQFVGLQGGFGFIGLGRQYSPGYFVYQYDAAEAASPLSPQSILSLAAGANITPNSPARVSNAINYKSPDFGGLKVNAIYGFNEANQTGNRQQNDLFAVGADYANGPIAAGLTYSQINDAASDDNKREWMLGAAYDFGMFKLAGSYQRVENATAAEDTDNVWQIGGIVPVGAAGRVHVAYGKLDADADDSDVNAWTVMYTHAMSKRTTAYAGYGQIGNDDNRAVSALANGSLGDNSRSVLVGMRHTF
jgi:predicted porin